MRDAQLHPVGCSSFSGPEFHRGFPLAVATFIATRVMVNHDQIYGLLGDVTFGAMEGRADACMDQFNQRRGVHHGIKFLTHPCLKRFTWMSTATFGTIQPLLALVLMGALVLGLRLGGERRVVPRQHQSLSKLVRSPVTQGGMQGCGLCTRREDSVQRGSNRLKKLPEHGISDLFDQAEQERQLCADAGDCAEPPKGGTQGEGIAEPMEQEIELIVAYDGVLTRVRGAFIVWETLVSMRLTCGVVEGLRGRVLLGHSRIGLALQWTAPVQKVLQRVAPIAHPPRVWARRVRARHEATAPIRGHPEAVEVVVAEVVTMGLPGLGRALRGPLHVQDGRTVRLHRDQAGLMAGKNLIAQIHHPVGLCR